MRYWITHPNLTAGHDHKVDAAALSEWTRSGWQVRDDQSDSAPGNEPADPRPPVDGPTVDTPAAVVPVTGTTTTKKGS